MEQRYILILALNAPAPTTRNFNSTLHSPKTKLIIKYTSWNLACTARYILPPALSSLHPSPSTLLSPPFFLHPSLFTLRPLLPPPPSHHQPPTFFSFLPLPLSIVLLAKVRRLFSRVADKGHNHPLLAR